MLMLPSHSDFSKQYQTFLVFCCPAYSNQDGGGGLTQTVSPPRFTNNTNSEFVTPERVDPLARLQGSEEGPRTAAPADNNAQETMNNENINITLPTFPFPAREHNNSGSATPPIVVGGDWRSVPPRAATPRSRYDVWLRLDPPDAAH